MRHFFLYQGNPSWSEEGHLAAWHMMLRSKYGHIFMRVTEDDGSPPYLVIPSQDVGVSPRQLKKVNHRPHATMMYVRHLGEGDALGALRPGRDGAGASL